MSHSVALTFKNQKMIMVSQMVNHGCGHLLISENTTPFGKFEVRCEDQALSRMGKSIYCAPKKLSLEKGT